MNSKKIIINIIKHLICIILCLAVILPFYMVLVNSFKAQGEAARLTLALPVEWHWENYMEVIEKGDLGRGFLNSFIYAGISTVVAITTCAMSAFVIDRNRTKFNRFLYYFFLCGLFVPVNYVTLVQVLTKLHITGTRVGIVVVFISSMVPFCVFVIQNFMSTVPVELDEAAVIDGAGPLSLFFRVIFPLLKPVLITTFLLQFMAIWSDFMTPLYLSTTSKIWPMSLAIYNFFGKSNSHWNLVFADVVLTCLPLIVLYVIGQKYIISGLTSGAVKE